MQASDINLKSFKVNLRLTLYIKFHLALELFTINHVPAVCTEYNNFRKIYSSPCIILTVMLKQWIQIAIVPSLAFTTHLKVSNS